MALAPLMVGHERITIPLAPHAAMTKLSFILTADTPTENPQITLTQQPLRQTLLALKTQGYAAKLANYFEFVNFIEVSLCFVLLLLY